MSEKSYDIPRGRKGCLRLWGDTKKAGLVGGAESGNIVHIYICIRHPFRSKRGLHTDETVQSTVMKLI